MKTSAIRHWRKRILSVTSVSLLAAVMSTSAVALPRDASGNLDINSNGFPRLSPDQCYSRTLKVRGGIIPQADRYLVGFCSSQRIFPPQIIQVLL